MDKLPNELIDLILTCYVQSCRDFKNQVLKLRFVSKHFDTFLRPYLFRTIQLESTKFLDAGEEGKGKGKGSEVSTNIDALRNVGQWCQALYCDMMVIRDEDEVERLLQMFQQVVNDVPGLSPLLNSFRKYTMREGFFDENDYRCMMTTVLASVPNLTRLKLTLPFRVIGKSSRTPTMLLANTFATLASRTLNHKPLEVLVIEFISDSTICRICNNPIDLANARQTFVGLQNLVLSMKRQESNYVVQSQFCVAFWDLIGHATNLNTLCIIGWNIKKSSSDRRAEPADQSLPLDEWRMKSIPYPSNPQNPLKHLRCLELKQVDIFAKSFLGMIGQVSHSLKELYLDEIHLKTCASFGPMRLWIGHAPIESMPEGAIWVAESLRNNELLKLDILRATNLGYVDKEPRPPAQERNYDLNDPSGNSKSFDLRFVEAAMRISPAPHVQTLSDSINGLMDQLPLRPVPKHVYEVKAYQRTPFLYTTSEITSYKDALIPNYPLTDVQAERLNSCQELTINTISGRRNNNTTSHFKSSIDGIFFNHSEKAEIEMYKIISIVDACIAVISDTIEGLARLSG